MFLELFGILKLNDIYVIVCKQFYFTELGVRFKLED